MIGTWASPAQTELAIVELLTPILKEPCRTVAQADRRPAEVRARTVAPTQKDLRHEGWTSIGGGSESGADVRSAGGSM